MNHFNNIFKTKQDVLTFLKTGLLFFAFLFAATAISAQEKTIAVLKGNVKNESNEPLTGATITVVGTKIIGTSKKDGTFELKNVPAHQQMP